MSPELSGLTGRSERDGLGEGWLAIVHPEDRAMVRNVLLEACRTQEPFSFQYRIRKASQVYRWVLAGAVPSFGPDQVFLGFLGSVTIVDETSTFRRAFGQVGRFQSPQPRPSTAPQSEIDTMVDQLFLARSLAQKAGHRDITVSIELTLELVAQRIAKLRPVDDARIN